MAGTLVCVYNIIWGRLARQLAGSAICLMLGSCLVGCSHATTTDQVAIYQQQLEARVAALQALGVSGVIVGHVQSNKLVSFGWSVEGPVDVDLITCINVPGQPIKPDKE